MDQSTLVLLSIGTFYNTKRESIKGPAMKPWEATRLK